MPVPYEKDGPALVESGGRQTLLQDQGAVRYAELYGSRSRKDLVPHDRIHRPVLRDPSLDRKGKGCDEQLVVLMQDYRAALVVDAMEVDRGGGVDAHVRGGQFDGTCRPALSLYHGETAGAIRLCDPCFEVDHVTAFVHIFVPRRDLRVCERLVGDRTAYQHQGDERQEHFHGSTFQELYARGKIRMIL